MQVPSYCVLGIVDYRVDRYSTFYFISVGVLPLAFVLKTKPLVLHYYHEIEKAQKTEQNLLLQSQTDLYCTCFK